MPYGRPRVNEGARRAESSHHLGKNPSQITETNRTRGVRRKPTTASQLCQHNQGELQMRPAFSHPFQKNCSQSRLGRKPPESHEWSVPQNGTDSSPKINREGGSENAERRVRLWERLSRRDIPHAAIIFVVHAPNAGGVSIRSRNGAPPRKGCVVNGQK